MICSSLTYAISTVNTNNYQKIGILSTKLRKHLGEKWANAGPASPNESETGKMQMDVNLISIKPD